MRGVATSGRDPRLRLSVKKKTRASLKATDTATIGQYHRISAMARGKICAVCSSVLPWTPNVEASIGRKLGL